MNASDCWKPARVAVPRPNGNGRTMLLARFAATPVALLVKDGIVISAKESDAAATPDPSWWINPD